MPRKPIDVIDRETGEVLQTGTLYLSTIRPTITAGKFMMLFQDALVMLAKDHELTLDHHRVLSFMLGHLNFDNWVRIKQADIAKDLKMDKAQVSRALAVLRRKEILLLAPEKGVRCYKINHWVGWKGSVVSFNKEMREETRKLKLVKSDKPKSP